VARRRHRGRRGAARPRPGGGDPAEEDELSALPGRRPGRRPGNPGTREAVLASARTAFAERGYDGATIRGIATAAGVDPALVHHYFGSKHKLFLASVEFPVDPEELLPSVLEAGTDDLGRNLLRTILGVWDSPAGHAGLAIIRSIVGNEWTARLLREFLAARILRLILGSLGYEPQERDARGALLASQVLGLVMARYVLKLEPIASASRESLVDAVGPTIQRYLTGDVVLPEPAPR
jgi:AcrR family transcriptional regulator